MTARSHTRTRRRIRRRRRALELAVLRRRYKAGTMSEDDYRDAIYRLTGRSAP